MEFVLDAAMGMLLLWPRVKSVSWVVECWDYFHPCLEVNSSMGRFSLCIIERNTAVEFLVVQSFSLISLRLWAIIEGSLWDRRYSSVQLTIGVSGAKMTNGPHWSGFTWEKQSLLWLV